MICSAKCSCFLCRELQSCGGAGAADRRARSGKPAGMCDNFILKKAEAFESSSAMRFIRGAARLSVRRWQSKESFAPVSAAVRSRPRLGSKSASCERLHPLDETRPDARRAPSAERAAESNCSGHRPLFGILGGSRLAAKFTDAQHADDRDRRSVLSFRKHETASHAHEKYVPLQQPESPAGGEHIYSEPRPPLYWRGGEGDRRGDRKPSGTRPPCYEELAQRLALDRRDAPAGSPPRDTATPAVSPTAPPNKITQSNNKVVIYFGDSIIRKYGGDGRDPPGRDATGDRSGSDEVVYANRLLKETADFGMSRDAGDGDSPTRSEDIYSEIVAHKESGEAAGAKIDDATYRKSQAMQESGREEAGAGQEQGMIVVRFAETFECARRLVEAVTGGGGRDVHEATILERDAEPTDWSFIQGWRKRPAGAGGGTAAAAGAAAAACRPHEEHAPPPPRHAPALASSAAAALLQPSRAGRLRAAHPAASAAAAHLHDRKSGFPPEAPLDTSAPHLRSVTAPSRITVQSTPVKCQNPMNSYGLERKEAAGAAARERRAGVGAEAAPPPPAHHHRHSPADVLTPAQNVPRECGSSSDENRSSGHASMSDSGGGGGGGNGAGEEPRARSRASSHHARPRHRQPASKLQSPWPGGGGLEDIRSAIKQLTLRSRGSTSTATSSAASGTGAADSARRRRAPLARQPSLDTVCTNVTSADEFVWLDSHNRLVELQLVPWSAGEVSRALASGRCREQAARMSPDTPPRLAYLLQRALVRVAREAQRLAHNFGFCSKHEVAGALRIVLSTTLADACIKSCQRAATMFAMSGDAALRQSKSARASTQLSPGKFQRWMVDMRIAPFVHEYAAIYLCAGMESLLEEVVTLAAGAAPLTPALLDAAIANSAELWGLLQPYAHLNAGRIATGALSLSRWASLSSLGSRGSASSTNIKLGGNMQTHLGLSQDSGITTSGSAGSASSGSGSGSARSVLLTTCVGSAAELAAVLPRATVPRHAAAASTSAAPPLSPHALHTLYYFMRCSQLEHSTGGGGGGGGGACQELWYERAYGVLPPLGEWLRVAAAHAELRGAPAVDRDDVQQAARLLLPGVDCAPRPLSLEEPLEARRGGGGGGGGGYRSGACEESARAAVSLAQRLLCAGRAELVAAARALLPPAAGLDALDRAGLTALMKAAAAGDEHTVTMLLEAGADPNVESPGAASPHALLLSPRALSAAAAPAAASAAPHAPSTAGWTALVYAAAAAAAGGGAGAAACCARLLAAGARVEGAAGRSDDVCTLTPLQVACGAGNLELVQLLLQHGAHPFLSTLLEDSLCYSGSAQRGCYSAISVCCSHGRRGCLRALLAHPAAAARPADRDRDVLSLEEILAEGAGPPAAGPAGPAALAAFTKAQLRSLQEAMYHAAETNHLDITLELRGLGVAWTLHAWMLSLAAAADAAADDIIDQLLQDFLQVCPSDDSHYSRTFIYDCLPLLFNIFRYSKKEGTILLLADILCACYGWEAVPAVREPPPPAQLAARIDPSFVNNPELSDVTFRVEGRLFYGHKIVLVTESPRFRAMLAPARGGGGGGGGDTPPSNPPQPPLVQINDIRYHIFQQVMKFLYSGGCATLDIPEADVLEVLAAASYFQLLPLQRHCEARAARALALHNLVSVYIHAKVYNAQQLLEYCQGFLLQNMVALLTYDESVKRLLFGKRLPGHNVLAALLHTLQQRIETRKNNKASR